MGLSKIVFSSLMVCAIPIFASGLGVATAHSMSSRIRKVAWQGGFVIRFRQRFGRRNWNALAAGKSSRIPRSGICKTEKVAS